TTVWDWIDQVNAANFAGNSDWRLPSEDGCNSCYTGDPTYTCTCSAHELESILLASYPCGTTPCINGIFGPTTGSYYSGSTYAPDPAGAWNVYVGNGFVGASDKRTARDVRAVRG